MRPPGEGQLRNRPHKFRNRTTKWRRSQPGGLQGARSSVSSAKNELFVQIEHRQFVRNPSLTPPLPYLASLPDTGDTLVFSPSQVCGASHEKAKFMNTHYYKIDRLRALRSSSLFEKPVDRVMCSLCADKLHVAASV